MKFAEAALFRLAVSPSGRVRSEIRQGRADVRFVCGFWLGKQDDHREDLARRPLKRRPSRHLPLPKEVSDGAKMQVSATVRRRETSLLRWSLMSSQFLVWQKRRTNRAQQPKDTDHGGAQVNPASDDHVQVLSSTPAPSSPDDRMNQGWQTERATSKSA